MTIDEKIKSYEERVEKIEAVLAGVADHNIQKYIINGREINRYSVSELINLVSYFNDKILNLKAQKSGRKIITRFRF